MLARFLVAIDFERSKQQELKRRRHGGKGTKRGREGGRNTENVTKKWRKW